MYRTAPRAAEAAMNTTQSPISIPTMGEDRGKHLAKVYPLEVTLDEEEKVALRAKSSLPPTYEVPSVSSSEEEQRTVPGSNRLIWFRVRCKLKGVVMLSLLCKELRLYGTSSFLKGQNINYKKNVEALLMRLRARKGDLPEQERNTHWFVMHPQAGFRKGWNFVVVALLLYTALIMPYRLAFSDYDDLGWFTIERIIDGLFFMDVVFTCVTGVELEDGTILMRPFSIFCKYARTWLILDLIACIPFSLISDSTDTETPATGQSGLIRIIRLPRLYRLLRIARLYRLVVKGKLSETLERLQDCLEINRGMTKIFYFAVTVLIAIHISGCLYYYMAKMQDFAPNTWVSKAGLLDQSQGSQYIAAMYWACYTLTTVGYGDLSGWTDMERIYSMLWMCFSVGFYSFTIGSLTSILSHLNSRNNILTIKVNAADQMAREGRLNQQLKSRLRRAIRINSQKAELDTGDKQMMFDSLPKKLRYEVSIAMYEGAAAKIPFFQGRSPEFISTIIPYLRYMYLDAGDIVYRQGDDSDELYIILRGRVTFIIGREAVVFKRMLEGAYFGDVEVILRSKRLCTCAIEYDGELLVMPKPMLKFIAVDFPEVFQEMEQLARERKQKVLEGMQEVEEAIRGLHVEKEGKNTGKTLKEHKALSFLSN